MQVNLNKNNYKQNFGMAIRRHPKDTRIANYLDSLSPQVKAKINEIEANNANNPINVFLSVIKKYGKERLKVEVGHKTFTEEYFAKNPIKAIKKGAELADKIHKEQKFQNDLWNNKFPSILKIR